MATCKRIKQKYNYTPSDYDLDFNFNDIPSNIQWEGAVDLQTAMNKTSPLSKTIHVTMNTTNEEETNGFRIKTRIQWRQ